MTRGQVKKRTERKRQKKQKTKSFCSQMGLFWEIFLSLLFALLLGVVGMLITFPIGTYFPTLHWGYATGYEVSGLAGWFIGIISGTLLALFVVSKRKKQKGCFKKALIGGILAAFVSFFLLGSVFPYEQIFFLLSAFPMVMAIVGYHWMSAKKELL